MKYDKMILSLSQTVIDFQLEVNPMRIAIIDDIATDAQKLYRYLCRWADEHCVPMVPEPDIFTKGEAFFKKFVKNAYDIIFLDIYMKGMTGMDVARKIRVLDNSCCLIFTTLSLDFAVESYEVDTSYYLVKPYSYLQLCDAMKRCKSSNLEASQSILFPGNHLLFLHQIAYTQYENRHIHIHLKDGEIVTLSMKHKDFARLLLDYPYFCDCMRGIIINFEAVSRITEDSFIMTNGSVIPVSRLKYHEVRERFLNYCYTKARDGGINTC